jgi:membrane protein YqaA with SNARE-associated domain
MMTLASIESLIGSVWGAVAAFAIGYIAGHLVPLSKIAGWIPGKKD